MERFEEHFKKLFMMNGSRNWGWVLDNVPKLVIGEMNLVLIKGIIVDEVQKQCSNEEHIRLLVLMVLKVYFTF